MKPDRVEVDGLRELSHREEFPSFFSLVPLQVGFFIKLKVNISDYLP